MHDRPEWFAPKRFGLGAGLPIAWQGWAVLAAFALAIGVATFLFGNDPRGLVIIIPAVAALLIMTALTTKSGWRWRWDDED